MSNYDNTNTGIVGKNDRKTTDTHPDITGSVNVEGVEYFLDGWHKQRKDGSGGFYSLKLKRKDKQPDGGSAQGGRPSAKTGSRDLDDEIPFATEWR